MQKPEDITINQINHLDSTPPEGHAPASVMTLEAEVEVKPQELKVIRPYYESQMSIPGTLGPEAQVVMHALFACFDRQGEIKEGKVTDIIFGFGQCGIHPDATRKGLKDLNVMGYVKLQAPDNTITTSLDHDKIDEYWIRYESKLLDLVYS
jgi:hypothetical protein